MNCIQCGHPFQQHFDTSDRRCRVRIAYDWDEKTHTFGKTAPCRCTGYKGVRPGGDKSTCPHEYLKTAPACVHCGHVLAAGEKRV